MTLDATLARIDAGLDASLDRLMALLRIPSISTDPAFKADCQRAAEHCVVLLQELGIDASVRPTPGHPMVVGHAQGPVADAPHLLFYGHYDVQPVDPLDLWDRGPFDPEVQDTPQGRVIRGRGTADDKGQFMTFLEAFRAIKAETGALPCKITVLFEGEEECGSPSLVPFLQAHADELRADIAVICDTGLYGTQTPAIVTMLRGLLGEELTITGPSRDLHSGSFGGIARNPARVLAGILAGLHDDQGRVQVPGFYDGIPEVSPEVQAQWDALAFDADRFLGDVGLSVPAGETDRTPLQMIWSRPTAEINGMWSGYTGDGFKTVLPSKASAKVSFRLVAGQDPLRLRKAFRAWVEAQLPADCTVTWKDHGAGAASAMDLSHPVFEAARKGLSDEWPNPAAFVGAGGSIPIAGHFQDILGMQSLLVGFSREDDGLHSPNEKYNLESFHKGTRSWARILHEITSR
jgi:acetylornithine deacetylase/succinyl-diaminopimelate desuccinylase-like protein